MKKDTRFLKKKRSKGAILVLTKTNRTLSLPFLNTPLLDL